MYVCTHMVMYSLYVFAHVCMYVCVYIFMSVCTHTPIHPLIYVHMSTPTFHPLAKWEPFFVYFDHKIRPHVYVIYVRTCMLLCMCFTYMEGKNIHVYICKWVGGWVYVYTHKFVYVCIFACKFESKLVCMHPATHPLMCVHVCALTFYPQWGPVTTKSPHCTTLQHAATLCNTPLSPSIQNGDP